MNGCQSQLIDVNGPFITLEMIYSIDEKPRLKPKYDLLVFYME